ncbi:MAG: hypothetical protein LC744_06560 [Chloroflexi bacterium]|nr:hypothetical protein [Chloroflexota bacterium]
MSREERRQYERMMRNMERGQSLPPAARARAERDAARRATRSAARPQTHAFTPRFLLVSLVIAAVAGLIGLSLVWSEGPPFALYVGLAVAAVTLALLVGFRLLQRRASRRA